MALQPLAYFKAVLKEIANERLCISQRHQTISNIPGWQDIHLIPEPPGTSSRIRDRDDGRNILGVRFDSLKQNAEACSSSNDNDPRTARQKIPLPTLIYNICQVLNRFRTWQILY